MICLCFIIFKKMKNLFGEKKKKQMLEKKREDIPMP